MEVPPDYGEKKGIPAGRPGRDEDMAQTALYIATNEYLYGQVRLTAAPRGCDGRLTSIVSRQSLLRAVIYSSTRRETECSKYHCCILD